MWGEERGFSDICVSFPEQHSYPLHLRKLLDAMSQAYMRSLNEGLASTSLSSSKTARAGTF